MVAVGILYELLGAVIIIEAYVLFYSYKCKKVILSNLSAERTRLKEANTPLS